MSVPPSMTERVDAWRVRVKAFRGMRTDGIVYATKQLWKQIQQDETLDQVANVATLPGLVGASLAMPDAHQGYGFPIGGVAATDPLQGGVVSPGGVGFDINCGVRLLATDLDADEARPRVDDLLDDLFRRVPVGFGKAVGRRRADMDEVLADGAVWAKRAGLATEDDLLHTEEGGRHPLADPAAVSDRAKERGEDQLGTLGSGNHFLEIQRVDEVFDDAAVTFGVREGQIVVLIHTGSRGVGHQVCQDYVGRFGPVMKAHGIAVPDRQLACAPVDSPEGRAYLAGMGAAANFAWANRQVITFHVRKALESVFGRSIAARLVYDVSHNMAKLEDHVVDGQIRRLCVHRKGAIRAFAAGRPELPVDYRDVGQPVFIPGSMGTSSWILVGTDVAMRETWGSVCHGAGRAMSRSAAKKQARADQVVAELRARGISIRSGSKAGIVEEFPGAYKDVSEVVRCVEGAGLARAVAKLVPLGVLKG